MDKIMLSRRMLSVFGVLVKNKYLRLHRRDVHSNCAILGIETSCDDTGCAIIDGEGRLLGETLRSQHLMHLRNGGIIPDVAQDLHRTHIEPVVLETLKKSDLSINNISAIAVTVEPGLPLSLSVGMKYAKYLSKKHNKPLIPIHHMQAHALTIRQNESVDFPYLVLLISGGHCLLALAQDVNKFLVLGESLDIAPGEMFDKIARRLKLRNLPEYSKVCGGKAVELAASHAVDPHSFKLPLPLSNHKDCNFSFNGLKTSVLAHIYKKERLHKTIADQVIPEANDLCAAMLMASARHLVQRTQRAIHFCYDNNLLTNNKKQLVVSGGVACNNFLFKAMNMLCDNEMFTIHRPPPKLCTDNGVMIAWNGLEKWRRRIDIVTDINSIDIKATSPLGEDLINKVKASQIPVKLLKLKL